MTNYDEVLDTLVLRPSDRALVIAVCNVHSLMSARKDVALQLALDEADIATPDGVPLVWGIRWTADPNQQRVYGPELMLKGLLVSDTTQWTHYLYGSKPETLALLRRNISETAPGARIVGSESPPFRDLTEQEEAAAIDRIKESGADLVWVGLGMPKQELWMRRVAAQLPGVALIGVGAAFDFIAGTKRQAPRWMRQVGLEWLFRLIQEPHRLWRRYLWNNPVFIWLLLSQIVRQRLSSGSKFDT